MQPVTGCIEFQMWASPRLTFGHYVGNSYDLPTWSRNRTGENRTGEPRTLECTLFVGTSVDTFVACVVGVLWGVLEGLMKG